MRYLRAMAHRLDKAPGDLRRDAERMDIVHRVTQDYEEVVAEARARGQVPGRRAWRSGG